MFVVGRAKFILHFRIIEFTFYFCADDVILMNEPDEYYYECYICMKHDKEFCCEFLEIK